MENEITIGTEESRTNDLVQFLLTQLKMDEYPLHITSKPIYILDVAGQTIFFVPEYVVLKDDKALFVDEDRHLRNTTGVKKWGEPQLAGEMLISGIASNRLEGAVSIYGVRVVGLKFTFYHSLILEEYYMKLGWTSRSRDILQMGNSYS